MLTIDYVREKYKHEYWDLSDQEVQEVLDFFYAFGYVVIDEILAKNEAKNT